MLVEKNTNFLNEFCNNIKPFLIDNGIDILPCLIILMFNENNNTFEYIKNIMLNKQLTYIEIDITNYWEWKKTNNLSRNNYCIINLIDVFDKFKKYNDYYELNIINDLYKNIGGIIYVSNNININNYLYTISHYIFWNLNQDKKINLIEKFNYILQKSISKQMSDKIKTVKTSYNTIVLNKLQLWPKYEFLN
jgi:hypothetical protein